MSTPFAEDSIAERELAEDSTVFPFEDSECDWGEVPERLTIDPGLTTFEIKEVSRTMSKGKPEEGKAPKAMIVVKSSVVEPPASSGMQFTHYLVIGSEEDPEAKLKETKMKRGGAVDFRNLIVACKIPLKSYKDSEIFNLLRNCRYISNVTLGKDGRNEAKGFYPVGDAPINLGTPRGAATRPIVRPTVSTPAPVQTQAKVACPTCDTLVNRSEYGAHLQTHDADHAQAPQD